MATFPHSTRVKTSTLNDWLRQHSLLEHKSVLYGMIKSKGKIKKGHGTGLNWNMRYMRQEFRNVAGSVTQTSFVEVNDTVSAQLDMCGYDMGKSIKKSERLANASSKTQVYNLIEDLLTNMLKDADVAYARRMWGDGSITGTDLYGTLSLYGGSSTANRGVYNRPDHTNYPAITCADGVTSFWACAPTQSYAGVPTALGNKVSDYSNANTDEAFPLGDFGEGYHFNTPLMIDYNSALFTPTTGSTHKWDTQWQQAFNAMTTHQVNLTGKPVDLVCWTAELQRKAQDSLIASERFIVTDSSPVRALGFKALEYNGTETLTEFGVPDGMAIGLDFDEIELYNWQDQLFFKDSDEDITTSESLEKIDVYTQLRFSSAVHFPALVPASAEGT